MFRNCWTTPGHSSTPRPHTPDLLAQTLACLSSTLPPPTPSPGLCPLRSSLFTVPSMSQPFCLSLPLTTRPLPTVFPTNAPRHSSSSPLQPLSHSNAVSFTQQTGSVLYIEYFSSYFSFSNQTLSL